MNVYKIQVLFFTGFNHFYDKIIKTVSVVAKTKEDAINKTKELYQHATNEMVMSCGTDCFVLGKWEKDLKYEIIGQVSYMKKVAEYVQKEDSSYGRCDTCKNYSNCNICSNCNEGSAYELDAVFYEKDHRTEIVEWIEKNNK